MDEHMVELVGGSQDGYTAICEDVTHRITISGERWEWDGEEPLAVAGGWLRRFHLVKATKETT